MPQSKNGQFAVPRTTPPPDAPQPGVKEQRERTPMELTERSLHSVVRIYSEQGAFRGSGVLVESNIAGGTMVLTARHLFGGNWPSQVKIKTYDNRTFAANFILGDAQHDLAALVVPSGDVPTPSPLTRTPTQAGELIYQIGYGGNKLQWKVARYAQNLGDSAYRFSIDPIGGDSGSGVFRTSDGHLIAIVQKTNGIASGGPALAVLMQNACDRHRPPQPKHDPPAPNPPSADLKVLINMVNELRVDIANIKLKEGPPGKDGKDGKDGLPGAQGPAGPQGVPGKDADSILLKTMQDQIDVLRSEIAGIRKTVGSLTVTVERVPLTAPQPK